MTTFVYDQRYVENALDELETYLLSDSLFWTIHIPATSNQPGYPKLTIGNLLLSIKRLKSHSTTHAQQAKTTRIENRLYAISKHWRAAWGKKVKKEFVSRLRQWGNYLTELDQNPEKHAPYYATEIRWRLLLDLLAGEIQDTTAAVNSYDPLLHTYFVPGEFIWDDEDREAFPKDPFWYLYGNLEY